MQLKLKLDKQYEPEAPLPNVYIKRSAFSGDIPQTIILTIEDSKDDKSTSS